MESCELFLSKDVPAPRGKKWRKERMTGKVIGNYTIQGRCNRGGTAVIYGADNCGRQAKVCKVTDGKFKDTLWKEFSILRELQHPNILEVYDCINCNKITAMSVEKVAGGDLHDYVIRCWPFSPDTRRRFSWQILSAVEHIHDNGFAHCDIKLENILIDADNNVKIIDFGSSLAVNDATFNDFAYIATTPEYLPPEIICARAKENYDIRAIDQWSVGVVLFIVLTGRFPFGEIDQRKIAKYIKKMKTMTSFELRQKEERFLYMEAEFIDLVRNLLQFDDRKRMQVRDVLTLPYFKRSRKYSTDITCIDDEIDADFEGIFDM